MRLPISLAVLKAIATNQSVADITEYSESQLYEVVEVGLGPILYQSLCAPHKVYPPSGESILAAADLTARFFTAGLLDAMESIVDRCNGRTGKITLLKGISICNQYYPKAHLRPMRDIDFLVNKEDLNTVESALRDLGYTQESTHPAALYTDHQHTMPFYNPKNRVWIEVHTCLFPENSRLVPNTIRRLAFTSALNLNNVLSELQSSSFLGKPVLRLSDELQIVYTAAHWAVSFNVNSSLIPMCDLIYILKCAGNKIDWDKILDWANDRIIASCVYLLLAYLHKHKLIEIPDEVWLSLKKRKNSLGKLGLHIMHETVETHMVKREPFNRLTRYNLPLIWNTLLAPRPPFLNFLLIPPHLIIAQGNPSRFTARGLKRLFHWQNSPMW